MKSSVVVLLAGLLLFSGAFGEDSKKEKAGLSFELKDTDGKVHKSSDLKDKYVVLEWTESDCPAVKPLYKSKNIQNLAASYKEKGVAWLAVCSTRGQTAEKLNAFRKQHDVKHPFLVDTTGEVGRKFGAKKTPHMFIVKNGKVLYQGAIDDRGRGGVNYVSKALDELLEGKEVSVPKTRPYG